MILKFIKLIPEFYKLYIDEGMTPADIRFSLQNYNKILLQNAGNNQPKTTYYPDVISDEIESYYRIKFTDDDLR